MPSESPAPARQPARPETLHEPSGYGHPSYAAALVDIGRPRHLPACGGWVLERSIPGTERVDGTGCYPLFFCRDVSRLPADVEALPDEWVSLCLVADPFFADDPRQLHDCFPDLCRPYKQHQLVDLSLPTEGAVSPHHLRNARRALRRVEVEIVQRPSEYLEEWLWLYAGLVRRHRIQGPAVFSRASFRRQLEVPGLVVLRAHCRGRTVGMLLWFVDREVGYYHLGAYSSAGYDVGASFALFLRSIEHFKEWGLRWLDLGAGAGLESDAEDGLTRFKRGWASSRRWSHLCGRILDRRGYEQLARSRGALDASYFPAYRLPENP